MSKITVLENLMECIDNNHTIEVIRDFYYKINNFFHNLPMFVVFSWRYRSWDYSYNVEIFVKLLERTGKSLRHHGWSVQSEKCARRCFTAAGLLRKAYLDQDVDNTLWYLMEQNPISFGNRQLKRAYKNRKIYDGMYNAADKRITKASKELKQEAWQYLNKYIEHFWD